ncbi:MAG TPA: Wzz/FepE/Etk N-terminal domain-containing protein [Candidatus Fermentibacter daniensis]|nr:Wzz/FepE/Etk N-terminal domain-containing protein [Candidatus Fermentibacter daniensis]HQM42077.1 Wzz/FepE/Etk N-terminal domain-containing protein [Candidatus Fermentibacter daniensis]
MTAPGRTPSWYLYVVLRNRWFLIKALAIIMVPTVVVSFLLPRKYTVKTVIMPPETPVEPSFSIGGMGISDSMGYFSGGMGFSLPLMTTMSDVYVEILNSRTLIDRVVLGTAYLDSMDLRRKYERDPWLGMYWARKMFRDGYSASVTPSGFIEVRVTTGDPFYSVQVSERVVFVLDSLNTWIASSRAERACELTQMRLQAADSLLANATDDLAAFEAERGLISPEEQLGELITSLAEMKRQYMEYRAAAQAISAGYGMGGTAASLEMERRAAAILEMIRELESGAVPTGMDSLFPAISLADFPAAQFEYARLRSDYEMALQLTAALRLSLEQARVEERRPGGTIRLLDEPSHPGWKSKPKKLLIWLEVFGIAATLLLTFLFVRENVRQIRKDRPESWAKWEELFSDMRRDFRPRRRRQTPDSSSKSSR